ncbi:hypothetical protein GOP47_0010601 [Adiantum capillus-veneris]|uniref:4-alpha-glucanotransferase n=1 Tax=Adiantum capillus-veneris TaxID=13818 RepID=A0A9D4UUW3_ADICA|nr:hypothetical protein GOP47_0010601 [Adiantum capillus-veneris]
MAQSLPARRRRRATLRFCLPYYTHWGQNLVLLSSDPALGSIDPSSARSMSPHHRGEVLFWIASMQVLRREPGAPRRLQLPAIQLDDNACIDIYDLWQDASCPESFLFRSAFRDVIFRNCRSDQLSSTEQQRLACQISNGTDTREGILVQFKVSCPRLQPGQAVCLEGDVTRGSLLRFSSMGGSVWQGECIIDKSKYVLSDESNAEDEVGPDRELLLVTAGKPHPAAIVVDDGYFKANPWRGAGLAVPVFSLRSEEDVGAGEFSDLKLLVDVAVKAGLHLIQLLPVNDTSVNGMWWDSYPYSSLSVFALHPLYLCLQCLSAKLPHDVQEEIQCAKKKLDLKDVDYDATMAIKLSIAKKVFKLEKDEVLNSSDYRRFFQENEDWLKPYAAFCYLRDFFGTSDHSQWGVYSKFSQEKLNKLVGPTTDHYGSIAFNYYLQYHLNLQLFEAANYARSNGVVLKGDLPIGVDRNSVDTWMYPTLFRMNTSTGAPPDYFDKNGQNWGFPTYNWEEMSKDNYGWWRARLTQMAKYFSAYRIDHVLGFFRIWELPDHAATGLMGKFRPSIPLSQEELERDGIWDFDRLSKPYIRYHILQEKFGESCNEVTDRFLNEYEHLFYEFKEEFNTEKKLVKALESMEGAYPSMKNRLIDLLQEVVLIRDPEDSKKFYPRFNLDQTASFRELDEGSQHVLRGLYHDYYFQRQEGLWQENAMKTLPALLNSSNMFACGEDLGLIPACVQPVLHDLGLVGLRIQRMPSTPGIEFALPADYEYATVCAPSCHDSSTLRAWWEEDETRRTRFYQNVLFYGEQPPAKCETFVVRAILQQHMEAPSMWAIFPIQDILALKEVYAQRPAKEEAINDPTNPKHYWRFRLHVTLETLLDDMELLSEVTELVEIGGRCTPSRSDITLRVENGNHHSGGEEAEFVKNRLSNGHKPGAIKDLEPSKTINGQHHTKPPIFMDNENGLEFNPNKCRT